MLSLRDVPLLFTFLLLIDCNNNVHSPKTEASQVQEIAADSLPSEPLTTAAPDTVTALEKRVPVQYEYFFVVRRKGIDYCDSPGGRPIGRFRMNHQLKLLQRNIGKDSVQEGKQWLHGEWWRVEGHKKTDTVYVFSGYLSESPLVSDIVVYIASPFIEETNRTNRTGFLNVSESYLDHETAAHPILSEEDMYEDTVRLSWQQRSVLLKKTGMGESDTVFIYDVASDSVHRFPLKDLPAIACINIYFTGGYEKTDYEYEFGFDLGRQYSGGDHNYAYVGENNPFQTGRIAPLIWERINSSAFPFAFDSTLIRSEIRWWLRGVQPGNAYKSDCQNLTLFLQDLTKNEAIRYRHLVVQDTASQQIVFRHLFIDSESTELMPLLTRNGETLTGHQWAGELFKGKPPVVFNFLMHSFGCPGFTFLSHQEPPVPILCDNRH